MTVLIGIEPAFRARMGTSSLLPQFRSSPARRCCPSQGLELRTLFLGLGCSQQNGQMQSTTLHKFSAVIERCPETGLLVGNVPGFPGAHSQGETLDELQGNLE